MLVCTRAPNLHGRLTDLSRIASFYGRLMPTDGDDALDNVDMQTDAGTAATTAFTRYTAAAASTRAGTVKSGYERTSSSSVPSLTDSFLPAHQGGPPRSR